MLVQYEILQASTEQHAVYGSESKESGVEQSRVDIGGAPQKRKTSGGCDRTDYRIRSESDTYP